MHSRKILTIALLALGLAFARAEDAVRFVYAQYFPANYQDASGRHRGFFIDIIEELFERRLGLKVEIGTYPWVRCQVLVEEGQADMIATIPTPDRLAYAEPVDPPIWIKKYRVYTWTGNPAADRIGAVRGAGDLVRSGFRVISYVGNSWSKTALEDSGVEVINAVDVEGMYRMLAARRADILVEDPLLARPFIASFGIERSIVLTEGLIDQSPFNLLLGKKSPWKRLIPDLDRALSAMQRDGTIDKIMSRYR